MIKPSKFAHVVYQTRRYDEMIAWYCKVFGARIVHRDPALAFLTYDDEHHRFAFANLDTTRPGGTDRDDRGTIGVNHVAYTYATVSDLLETYARLKDEGIEPYWSIHHGITLSNYYRDPDGNRMEFQVDADLGFMDSPDFAANPIGVEVDMDDLLARYCAGEDPDRLKSLSKGPMSPIPELHGMT
jgi:catechol 2,3-dioxygenase-like lactoylglutathione lyase family enzyme